MIKIKETDIALTANVIMVTDSATTTLETAKTVLIAGNAEGLTMNRKVFGELVRGVVKGGENLLEGQKVIVIGDVTEARNWSFYRESLPEEIAVSGVYSGEDFCDLINYRQSNDVNRFMVWLGALRGNQVTVTLDPNHGDYLVRTVTPSNWKLAEWKGAKVFFTGLNRSEQVSVNKPAKEDGRKNEWSEERKQKHAEAMRQVWKGKEEELC